MRSTFLIDCIDRIERLCKRGYAENSAAYYQEIDSILADLEQTAEVQKIRNLAAAGPALSSARFAYPHIQDRLDTLQ